uniref:Uncharacterized protein n=1 Tax=Anguilla anguilla TaxID=7936 RepID=A0A0E9RDS9_ANGAN
MKTYSGYDHSPANKQTMSKKLISNKKCFILKQLANLPKLV